ncbi:plantaricin C family lantibiotic [Streptomonospora wellingtoniae]|uniref:Plantaricin C family lantibiotic n=1 Tax=Streptomonospora wellingtoniae TaxID=3075544 RepID=A0ABU2KT60_9ACTN|nr:plantaricin C family lantibiotic [Streptomonospora sp. DSM 45055]MDT0302480.1 plantaricin C family lantibiotic [Streptomonospora sp. DSM 45055]
MANPNVGILEEIDDQHLAGISVGAEADPNSVSIASLCTSCLASWAIGNDGWACTATVECQSNC